ncbi:MAG TPA: cupin domain-containing protein [Chloroflexota bacterium]|jgi:mannose-6-phosphate isomerase-like protein (cupin superfamily)|nr:cupin domain-containing protein [Chloroflexota bacterium]
MPENPSPISVRLRCEQTKSRRALMENRVDADFAGPPLHVHPDFDETFHVLEGELTFQLGDQRLTAGAGALVVAPGETPHTYANLSREEARPLLLRTPAGFERYFDRTAAEFGGVEPPPSPAAHLGDPRGRPPDRPLTAKGSRR